MGTTFDHCHHSHGYITPQKPRTDFIHWLNIEGATVLDGQLGQLQDLDPFWLAQQFFQTTETETDTTTATTAVSTPLTATTAEPLTAEPLTA